MYALGIDLGSSSVKVSILDIETGENAGSAFHPERELAMHSVQAGWAEQDPGIWWQSFLKALELALATSGISATEIESIGISYQMHGLVVLDKHLRVLRPSIIWCDSRAVEIGKKAYDALGADYCNGCLLNSPGNFTASKLRWVRENEPEIFSQVAHFMLPGDFMAFKLSGEVNTTASGLSEGVLWDFEKQSVSETLLDYYGIDPASVPEIVPTFGIQANVSGEVAGITGLRQGTPIAYRAGDQPNNAFSLNVLNPGEIAATAGTSGVIYAVSDQNIHDTESRVNTFLHTNNQPGASRNGVLLCVNGTGILNSWLRKYMGSENLSYEEMNKGASNIPVGTDGLKFFPFGNGAERVLKNQYPKAALSGLDFNRHSDKHVFRAAQEGIVFALRYGFDVLREIGVKAETIRAGKANMFLSPVFREAFVNTVGVRVELYETDGAEGAARGGALGAGLYDSFATAFTGLKRLEAIDPEAKLTAEYEVVYKEWKKALEKQIDS